MTRTVSPEVREYRNDLRASLLPGSTVHTILRHVSQSGMTRWISPVFLGVTQNGKPYVHDLTYSVEQADLGFRRSGNHQGLKVGGAGMDMGFRLVYSLSRALYPDGHRCTGERGCPSNDHSNDFGRLVRKWEAEHGPTTNESIRERNEWISAQVTYSVDRRHSDGGYALRQAWL